MKYLYNTPEIQVEELAKADVLCASNEEVQTNEVDNYTLSDFVWDQLSGLG